MLFVKVEICRYVDASFPGWVECSMVDARGHSHVFVDKIPAFTEAFLDEASVLPQPGFIACVALARQDLQDGRQIVLIDTALTFGIESSDEQKQFHVFSEQLCELPREDVVG